VARWRSWADNEGVGRGAQGLVAAIAIAAGCYHGVSGSGDGDGDEAASGDAGDDGDGSESGDANELCADPSVDISPLRRLTRSQYDHTVRDLLGIDGNPSALLAPDEKVGAFFSNASAPVSELVAEQYMRVAEDLADQAVAHMPTLVPCDPLGADPAACGAEFVDAFGLRAFRRPLTAEERTAMIALFELGRADEGFEGGFTLVVQAFLESPQFLYHLEFGLPAAGDENVVALDPYEVASRLSYFLWDSMPDDALFAAAGAGELDTPEALRAHAERLLADPRAALAIASFHMQWLKLDKLATLEKDATVYPSFAPEMRVAMATETARFADHVVRVDDGRLETLLTASYSFLDGPLFALYGVAPPADHDPSVPVELDPTQRAGLLTQASVLATHAHADQSSPVHRGVLVREHLLCEPLNPPPPDVDIVPPEPDPDASTRERFEQHRTDPACAGCHALIDPLGFGFEHYDGIGAYRAEEAGKPVDATGQVVGGDAPDTTFDGAIELGQMLAASEQVRTCVAQQWFTYGFGRSRGDGDDCSFDEMYAAFAESGHDIRELLLAMVVTDSFRHRRIEGAP
jgi:hypothetical protein